MPNYRVRVGGPVESTNMFGVLVDIIVNPDTGDYSASRLEWFPKSLCELEAVEVEDHLPAHYLTAPEWLLKKNKVKYESCNTKI